MVVLTWLVMALWAETPGVMASEPPSPHLQTLFAHLDARRPSRTPAGLFPVLGDSLAVALTRADLTALLDAAAADRLTLLRATALFARWVRVRNVPVFIAGQAVEQAVRTGYALGLTFPVEHIAYLCFVPDRAMGGDFQAHLRVIYTRNYTYPFDKDIFNADVLVRGREMVYRDEKGFVTGYLVTTDVYYNASTVQYVQVEGIQGQKRGVVGLFQKMFFFIPKTLHGLTIRGGDLIIDAFVNQRIRAFEHKPRYRVTRR
jgi:hypothetical protein